MKENPNPDKDPEKADFKGDNWVKFTGEAVDLIKMEDFMFKANEIMTKKVSEATGNKDPTPAEVNTMGVPTQISLLAKEHDERTQIRKDSNLSLLLAKYGGEKHLSVPEEIKA